ncbi:MAG: phenylalanine--tRNA ligase subunit beta [Planctomycetota bacterium]
MLVSLRWLANYLPIQDDPETLANRLSMSGLNHEGTFEIDGDTVFDLEVTSNRGDCLGHLGVAREIGALDGRAIKRPDPQPPANGPAIDTSLAVENDFIEACPRYTARLIRGVTIGPSPDWMIRDLQAVYWKAKSDGSRDGYKPINNVVDATNYVLMECGSPLHAFDYAKLADQKIVIRRGKSGETMRAIDHRDYEITTDTCVIADASAPQAIGGVMGGADSEVTSATRDIVIEAATFTPLSIRRTARRLKLHSPSSYRFERRVDPHGLDWASRRVCQLILETAGGTLASGMIDTAPDVAGRDPIKLQWADLSRILGIDIDPQTCVQILTQLGCNDLQQEASGIQVTPPTWRHDLSRGADLVEEIARIHGYDKIPEDSPIPVVPSRRRVFDDACDRIRAVLTSAGLSEAMTPSVVTRELDAAVSPWTDQPALQTLTPMLKGARTLRRSLLPSLAQSRAKNWSAASIEADLFEIAHVYLPAGENSTLPAEQYAIGLISGGDYFRLKGAVTTLAQRLGVQGNVEFKVADVHGMQPGSSLELHLDGKLAGYMGRLDAALMKRLKLPGDVNVAELSLPVLLETADLVPKQQAVSAFPSIRRDLNFVVKESVRWADLESVARKAVGETLAGLDYQETYRDPGRDGAGTKRLLMTIELQRQDATLSGDQADRLVQQLIDAASKEVDAKLLA